MPPTALYWRWKGAVPGRAVLEEDGCCEVSLLYGSCCLVSQGQPFNSVSDKTDTPAGTGPFWNTPHELNEVMIGCN